MSHLQDMPAPILIVEDNPINLKVAQGLVARCGYQTMSAANGQEALDMLSSKDVDIVLMDIHMPVMDGLETTRRLRAMEGAGAPRRVIIALTTQTGEEDRHACRDAGMDDFIPKPIVMDLLQSTLDKWSDQLCAERGIPRAPSSEAAGLPRETGAPLIDYARLEEFTAGSRAATRELADLYLGNTAELLELLNASVAAGDIQGVRRASHTAYGSSASCGMLAILPPLGILERQSNEGSLVNAQAHADEACRQFERLRLELEGYVAALRDE